MGDAIIDHLEKEVAGGKQLFDQRFHAQDCDMLAAPALDIKE